MLSASKQKYQLYKPQQQWAILLGTAAVLAATPLAFISFGLVLCAGARLLQLRLGLWTSLTVSFLCIAGYIAMIAAAAWLLRQPLSTFIVLILLVATLLALVCAQPTARQPRLAPNRDELINNDDIISVIVGIACMVVVCIPLFPRPSASTVLPVLMYGGDNSAHLDMFRTIDRNAGFAIGSDNRANLGGILVAYPQGWHFMGVFTKWTLQGVVPISASPSGILLFFYATSALWLGMLALLITRLALLIVHKLLRSRTPRVHSITAGILVGVGCFVGINGFLLSLFAYGFQTQVAALTFLLAEVAVLIIAYTATSAKQRFSYLLVATLLLAGGGFSWLFLYPIGALLLAGAIAHTIFTYRQLPLYFVVGLVIVGLGVCFQPLVQILVPVPAYQDGVNVINQRGNVALTSMPVLGLLALGAGMWAYVYFRQVAIRVLLTALATAMLFSLALMWYQLGTIQELRYYYYKSTYTGITFVIILLSAALGWAAATLLAAKPPLGRHKWLHFSIVIGGLLGFVVITTTLISSPSYDGFLKKSLAGISSAQGGTIVDIVATQPQNAWRVLSIGSCNRGDDIRATLLASSFGEIPPRGTNSPGTYIKLDNIEKQALFAGIQKFLAQDTGTPSLIILSNDQIIGNELLQSLSPTDAARIQLINLDPSAETEPAEQCFDRIR